MSLVVDAKSLVLDGLYYVPENIMTIRTRFFDLVQHQFRFSCRVKSYPHWTGAPDEFNHLCLIDNVWGECGELEFIDLDGSQTKVHFYLPSPFVLPEIEEREQALRRNYSRSRIGLWIYENLGWTPKVIDLFAEELYEHKVTCPRNIQDLVIDRLGMNLYPASSFEIQPEPQAGISQNQPDRLIQSDGIPQFQPRNPWAEAGISQNQPDTPKSQVRIFQTQSEYPWTQAATSQNQPDHVQPQTRTSQVQQEGLQQKPGISQKPVDSPQVQIGVNQVMPAPHPTEGNEVSLSREDQELLRLWSAGLTAKEIGTRTGKTGKTVMNRLSVLRGMYGEERIPLRKKPTRKDLG